MVLTSPALLVVRGLRADTLRLLAALSKESADPALLCAASAELVDLVDAHVLSGLRHAVPALPDDQATRAAAQLREQRSVCDAVGDATAVLLAAGLSDDDRNRARSALTQRWGVLMAALPTAGERCGACWDTAAVACTAPAYLVLGSALREVGSVPEVWREPWELVRAQLPRSALHRLVTAAT